MTAIMMGVSAGLGAAGAASGARAANAQERSIAAAEQNAREATTLVYENLALTTRDRVSAFRDFSGALENAVASSGVEVGSGITAQMKADAMVGLRRDVEALRLNADAQATQLGWGPDKIARTDTDEFDFNAIHGGYGVFVSDTTDPIVAAREAAFSVGI